MGVRAPKMYASKWDWDTCDAHTNKKTRKHTLGCYNQECYGYEGRWFGGDKREDCGKLSVSLY